MLLFLSSVAAASPGSAGAVHLGAQPLPAGTQFAGFAGGLLWTPGGAVGAPLVEVGTALGDRFALTATAGVTAPVEAVPALISARWIAVDDEETRVSLGLSATVLPYVGIEDGVEVHLTPVLALDSGGEKLRFDAAIPLWGISSYNQYVGFERFPVPVLSTFGVSGRLGEHQRLRFGLPELLSWHYRGERVYVDIGGITVLVAGAMWAKVGVMF
jgi:hypothetical protein